MGGEHQKRAQRKRKRGERKKRDKEYSHPIHAIPICQGSMDERRQENKMFTGRKELNLWVWRKTAGVLRPQT